MLVDCACLKINLDRVIIHTYQSEGDSEECRVSERLRERALTGLENYQQGSTSLNVIVVIFIVIKFSYWFVALR